MGIIRSFDVYDKKITETHRRVVKRLKNKIEYILMEVCIKEKRKYVKKEDRVSKEKIK